MLRKYTLVLVFIVFFSKTNAQVIDFSDGKLNCDTAYSTLELGLCSQFLLEQSIVKYDSLIKVINVCMDTLALEDYKLRADLLLEDSTTKFDDWTDYRKIKLMFNQSDITFKKFAELEMSITGEFYGVGRERSIGENVRMKQLYDERISFLLSSSSFRCHF